MKTYIVGNKLWSRRRALVVFVLIATFISFLFAFYDSRTVKAEGLLDDVTCIVKGLLKKECVKPAPPANQPTPSTSSPQPTTASSPQPISSNAQPVTAGEPIAMTAAPLPARLYEPGQLEGITSSYPSKSLANVLPVSTHASDGEAILGQAEVIAPIQATQQGWLIYSIPWYWWVVIAGTAAAILGWIVTVIRHRNERQ